VSFEIMTKKKQTNRKFLSRLLVAGLSIAFAGGKAYGQFSNDIAESLERNRQELAELNPVWLVKSMLRIRDGKERLAIELDEQQSRQLSSLASSISARYASEFNKGISYVDDRTEYRKAIGREVRESDLELQRTQIEQFRNWKSELESILLPHQLKQLQFAGIREAAEQENPEFGTLGVALGLSDELKLDAAKRTALREATEKAVVQYRAEAAELNKKAWAELLAALPKEKRKELEELVGELSGDAEFDPNSK
jgi:hypothetical protein